VEERGVVETSWNDLAPLLADCLQRDTDVVIAITGTSMLPLLRAGIDRVVLTSAKGEALKKGDIPFYRRRNGQFVLHRVVAVTPKGYTMTGDAQTLLEPGIQPDQILAVVKGIWRGERYVPCGKKSYRFRARLWMALRPVRPFLMRVYRVWRKILSPSTKSEKTS
jgi:signal peptidase